MATIDSAPTLAAVRAPFINQFGQPDVWATLVPRSELVFSALGFAITLSGVGDDQRVIINCDLPSGFAYVLMEASLSIDGAEADEWDTNAFCSLADSAADVTAKWKKCLHAPGLLGNSAATSFTRCYVVSAASKIILPGPGLTGRLQLRTMNLTTNKAALVGTAYARFLLFDVNQAQFNAIHTPVPVR